ncbi:MAG: cyclic nucleotide-binding domain-containing protein [Halofilum sp. (in: g-proteobacteria)]|nr:cyclic nucleotide-binding domain-containing protein [Halofilum sp. (in: g-proteobacteria)]
MSEPNVNPSELSRFIPLNSLSKDNLKELAQKARTVKVASGRFLFRDGKKPPMHLFLLQGEVDLLGEKGPEKSLKAGSEEARHSLETIHPSATGARAKSDVTALGIDRDLLDLMLTWDQTGSYEVDELDEDDEGDGDSDWMTRLLQTDCFRRIPPANIQAIFMRMEPVSVKAGENVVTQGEAGDYFYIIREGRCVVTRTTKTKPEGVRLAELGPGDSFGEEALISNKERNATVTMRDDGSLMRMSKEDFTSLLNEPLLDRVSYDDAVQLGRGGATWIDVRLPPEFEGGHIQGATNIPLFFLRKRAESLDTGTEYIVYCDTGSRSSAASFLLSERGFQARVLKGGLAEVPADALVKGKE